MCDFPAIVAYVNQPFFFPFFLFFNSQVSHSTQWAWSFVLIEDSVLQETVYIWGQHFIDVVNIENSIFLHFRKAAIRQVAERPRGIVPLLQQQVWKSLFQVTFLLFFSSDSHYMKYEIALHSGSCGHFSIAAALNTLRHRQTEEREHTWLKKKTQRETDRFSLVNSNSCATPQTSVCV